MRGEPRWKTWHVGTATFVSLLVGVGIGAVSAGGGQGAELRPEANGVNVRASEVGRDQLSATTTRPAPTTSTTVPAVAPRDVQLAAMAKAFEGVRVRLADAVKDDNRVEVSSVDRLELEQAGPTIVLNASSTFSTERILRDGAWAVTKSMQTFWEARNIASIPDVVPKFRLSLSTVRYECPAAFMVRLAELRASREDWEATCRA